MAAIANLLQGAFSQQSSGNQTGTPPERAAMAFTSRLRSGLVAGTSPLEIFLGGTGSSAAANQAVTNQQASFFKTQMFMPVINMSVNPNSVTFSQPKRWTKKDTRNGSVYFHFTNTKGQNNDILTLSFKGNTGSIDLRASLDPTLASQGLDTGAFQKFMVWHNLYLLTREPMLLTDGAENVFSISYASKLFPEIIFNGFFNKVLEFEESAKRPNSQDYSFEFTVTSTIPDLDEVLAQIIDLASTPATSVHVPFPAGTHGVIRGTGGLIVGPVESGQPTSGDTESFTNQDNSAEFAV